MSKPITIAVLNKSTACKDVEIAAMTAAIQKQVTQQFGPLWDLDADLLFVPAGQTPPVGAWLCTILDTADVQGALGYHDEGPNARPYGRIFAKTTLADGEKVSVTLSHEILEMLADPYVRLGVFVQTRAGQGRIYAYETADAVEAYAYLIDGIAVSDFVTPAYFDPTKHPRGTKFDYLGKLTKPFQIAPGGYLSVFDVPGGGQWQQVTALQRRESAHRLPAVSLPKPGSRRERRNQSHRAD